MRVKTKRDILFLHGTIPAGTTLNVISLGACTDDGRGVSGLSIDAVEFLDGLVNPEAASAAKANAKPPWMQGEKTVNPLPGQKTSPNVGDPIPNEYVHEEFRRLKKTLGEDVVLIFKTANGRAVYNGDCGTLSPMLTASGIDWRDEHARTPHVHRVRFPDDRMNAVTAGLAAAKVPFAYCIPDSEQPGKFLSTVFREAESFEALAESPGPLPVNSLDDLDL